jgi:hypothetical protein
MGRRPADPREHRRPAQCRHQDQGFHRRLPLRGFVLGLGKLRDVIAGILESDKLATAGAGESDPRTIVSSPAGNSSACALDRLAQSLHGELDIG